MDKQSIIQLQNIDCNCNNCKFMDRDFITFTKWENWNREIQLKSFEKKKQDAIDNANACTDEKGKRTLMNLVNKMQFIFDKSGLLQYGKCTKLNKDVSFIPNTCQIDTQSCFVNRVEL